MRSAVVVLAFAPLLAACVGQRDIVQEQAHTIDSLYVVERGLLSELYTMQDSIRYYDDIDSGYYFRKQRSLQNRIDELEYRLATRDDTLCNSEVVENLLVDDLFEPASATLSEEGEERLARLAELLIAGYSDRRLRVEGHSDNVPLGPTLRKTYASNWELSAARATTVVRNLTDRFDLEPVQFEAVALADTQPVAPNTTADGRRLNRRIRVLALPRE